MDTLTPESLEWVLAHIHWYGDTDVFPKCFEFNAIRHSWSWLKGELLKIDLTKYRPTPPLRILVPKPTGDFRVACRLDPIASLIYAAMIYEDAVAIENSRVEKGMHIACSYRVQLDADGRLFPSENGWPDFQNKSLELIEQDEHEYVVFTDISDFYNQVYLHRVENALESAEVGRAKTIENFLTALTGGQSRGIPVGPSASILLAEVALNDVDMYLMRKNHKHVRYVDDFRIFCKSHHDAVNALHDLSEYLFTAHRLSIQPLKTRIVGKNKAIEEFTDPDAEERRTKIEKINEAIEELGYHEAYGYHSGKNEIDESAIALENLSELFLLTLKKTPIRLGSARYLLRRATQLRTNVISSLVLENLEVLLPVLREVAIYILATKKSAGKKGEKLINLLENSAYRSIPFVQVWGNWLLCEYPELTSATKALNLAEMSAEVRLAALVARAYALVNWTRERKETWATHGPWDRRAIIYSALALPRDERIAWLEKVEASGDMLDRATAQLVRAESGGASKSDKKEKKKKK